MTEPVIVEPRDEHNEALVAHVHPADWANPTPEGTYNIVVIGAGTAGLVTAAAAAGLGARVALIERHLMGGDCLNVGCVPSKALLAAGRSAHDARRSAAFGVATGDVEVDFREVMARMRRLRAGIAPHDSAARFRDLGIDVYLGNARFSGPRTVEVDGQQLTFAKACIATGARAAAPPIGGLETIDVLTNETLFSLTALPPRLIVVGAGPIGVEMAQAFARFGSEVHLLERGGQILGKEDPAAAALVAAALERDGVHLHLGARELRFEPHPDGAHAHFTCAGARCELVAEQVLVAVGRAPNVQGLGLDEAGVAYDAQTGVQVDARLRTANKRIFAAGDVCSRFQFTHAADHMARIVIRNALFGFVPGRPKVDDLVMPWCTYSDPEIAHVGQTAADLERDGRAFDTVRVEMARNDRAILEGDAEGFLAVHVEKGKDTILGATLVSRHAGETIGELVTAMTHGIGLGRLASVIHPYPTQAEIVARAADAWNRTRLTPRKAAILAWLMRRQV